MEGKDYLLALCQCAALGPSRLARLRTRFNSWKEIWEAPPRELLAAGLASEVIAELHSVRKDFDWQKLKSELERYSIKTIAPEETLYPRLLKQTHLPPLLYYKGALDCLKRPTLAVVGTRKPTPYGLQITSKLLEPLIRSGVTIVSGLALGIDALAHTAAIDGGGETAAVLGCGLDTIYPATNRRLAERVTRQGCLISEFRPGTPAYKTNFPRRNRLIAGLSLATLVIEAAGKSGALITAHQSLNDNRDVLAVPGNILSPYSEGTNALLKLGAKVITSADDIFEALGLTSSAAERSNTDGNATPEEKELLALLGSEALHINELVRRTALDIKSINSRLTVMELNGLVKNVGNTTYVRL